MELPETQLTKKIALSRIFNFQLHIFPSEKRVSLFFYYYYFPFRIELSIFPLHLIKIKYYRENGSCRQSPL